MAMPFNKFDATVVASITLFVFSSGYLVGVDTLNASGLFIGVVSGLCVALILKLAYIGD